MTLRVRLVVEYDGKNFSGWQRQNNARTVQGELESAVGKVLQIPPPSIVAAGRTDAGVHARGQVVHFDLPLDAQLELLRKLPTGISGILPGEVSILSYEVVPLDFHARFSASQKCYQYRILNRPAKPTWQRNFCWHVTGTLRFEHLQQESQSLLGERDFRIFQGAGCTQLNTEKRINGAQWSKEGENLVFTIMGSGFLKHMVRMIVGTLIFHDQKDYPLGTLLQTIQQGDTSLRGPTAPANGLTLHSVIYPDLPPFKAEGGVVT